MLKHTFCHLPGIGRKTEARLWASGIRDWDDLSKGGSDHFSKKRMELFEEQLDHSRQRLEAQDALYFARAMPTSERWRLFPAFRERMAYIDIETTGLYAGHDHITTIALYDGQEVYTFVHGQDLESFLDRVLCYRVVVTYNGRRFDVPFIERSFGIDLEQPNIDLMDVLHSLGYKGGLKACERQLGIDRGELADLDGAFAVRLWVEYDQHGEKKALETLLAYNVLDVVGLEELLVIAYNMKIRKIPWLRLAELPRPCPPRLHHVPDLGIIRGIRCSYAM